MAAPKNLNEYQVNGKTDEQFKSMANYIFSKILMDYMNITVAIEHLINVLISTFFLEQKKKQDIISEIILADLTVAKKIQILKNILYKISADTFLKYEDTFKKLSVINNTRNKLAHSIVLLNPKFIKARNLERIPYSNISHSFHQPLFVSYEQYQKDFEILAEITLELGKLTFIIDDYRREREMKEKEKGKRSAG